MEVDQGGKLLGAETKVGKLLPWASDVDCATKCIPKYVDNEDPDQGGGPYRWQNCNQAPSCTECCAEYAGAVRDTCLNDCLEGGWDE